MNSSKSQSGRRRWTDKQRQRFLARFHQSQLTQRDFAGKHGVGLSTLSKWLRVENEAPSPPKMSQRYAVEVVSPQGWTVRLQSGSDLQQLPALLQALPC